MTSSFCTKCGASAVPGKRFCTKCGQPIDQASVPTGTAVELPLRAPAPEPAADMSQQTTARPIPTDRPAEVASAAAAGVGSAPLGTTRVAVDTCCTQCGSPVLAGKKFCTKCGNPITQVALRTETLNDVVESLNSAKESTSLITELPLTTEAPVAVDVNRDPEDSGKPVKMSVSSPERMDIPEETPTLAIPEADADADMVAPPASTAADEPFSASPESATRKGPSHFLILLGGVAACLLVIAIAVSLYISHNKPASPAAPATASKASQNSPPASISEANKPSAAKHGSEETVNAGNEAPQAKASAQALEAPSRIDAKQKSSTEVAVSPIPKEPVTKLPERRTAATSQSSGTLHYAGAPVHFGETVTFTNLPSAQLKFTFDHRAWRPLISRQSDGTKKLTLRSLKRVEQTTCDVAWEVMPESANSELVQKTSERCEILPSDISNYLDRADRDRAAGHYVDAARQYSKVIECDSNNATARQGLTRTRQAQAASGRDSE